MSSIARVLTNRSRSTNSLLSRSGSLRATSRSVCVTASGVRSSCEALAANRCCSARCASSRSSMASNASASSRNSSRWPGNSTRCESDPLAAMRVASVMRVNGASIRPARNHPPTRPNTSKNTRTTTATGAKSRNRSAWLRTKKMHARVEAARQRKVPGEVEQHDAGEHDEAGVAQGEFEANAEARPPIHAHLLLRSPGWRPGLRRCGNRRRPPSRSTRARPDVCVAPTR